MNYWSLEGKKAVVTGGTKGIGLAIAQEFLDLGAEVLVVARDTKQIENKLRGSARLFRLDGDVTAAFVIPYGVPLCTSKAPAYEAMLITLAWPEFFSSSNAPWVSAVMLKRFVSNTFRYSSSVYSINFFRILVPTLLTSKSSLPQFSFTF